MEPDVVQEARDRIGDRLIIRIADVEKITGLKRSTIYTRARKGTFPKSIALTPKARGWVASHILAWLAARWL